ncbi:MAG: hypothetical protein KDK25_03345 [Leptospiraceae bacterium]|nr:hypothetical protein [Leptospiraceae bacterium]
MRSLLTLVLALAFSSIPLVFWIALELSPSLDLLNLSVSGLAAVLIFLLLWGFALELYFQLIRIPGALLLRVEGIWNFASPALAIFLLTAEPLVRWSGILDSGPLLPAMEGQALWLAGALGLLLLLLFVFPLFRGMNATFILAGVLGARFLLIPASIGPESSLQQYAVFSAYSLLLSFFLFLFLQSRRRLLLSPEYETFSLPPALRIAAFFAPFAIVGLHFAIVSWYRPFPGTVPAIIAVFLASYWWITMMLLKRDAAGFRWPPALAFGSLLFAGLLFLVLGQGLVIGSCARASLRSAAVSESMTFFAAFLDGDGDGNAGFPGTDPDDRNPEIRADFFINRGDKARLLSERNPQGEGRSSEDTGSQPDASNFERRDGGTGNRRLLTVFLDLDSLMAFSPESRKAFQVFVPTTNDLPFALRDLLHSTDPIRGSDSRSALSEFVDRGYRTICTGNGSYFSHSHAARLDEGCQVLEPAFLTWNGKPLPAEGPLKPRALAESLDHYFYEAGLLFRKYREDSFFFWLHLDLRGQSIDESILEAIGETWDQGFEGSSSVVFIFGDGASLGYLRPAGRNTLFASSLGRQQVGFVHNSAVAPWSAGMLAWLGLSFRYPFQSFGLQSGEEGMWIRNQMTGGERTLRLFDSKSGQGPDHNEQRRIENVP